MKRFVLQLITILGVSVVFGLAFNQFSKTPLPVFQKYDAHMVDLVVSGKQLNLTTSKDAAISGEKETEIPHFDEIDAESLLALVESGSAVLLDARPPEDFRKGRIPCGISLPITRFSETYERVAQLIEPGKTIITYCEGYHCTDSSLLALALQKKGHTDIFVYKGGIEEWIELEYDVDIPVEGEQK